MHYIYVLGTIVGVVYGQLILKWAVTNAGTFPINNSDKFYFLIRLLVNPFVISGFAAAFFAALCWMAAVAKFELSQVYPILVGGLAILTCILSVFFFKESFGIMKLVGLSLIVAGLFCIGRG